MEFPARIKRTKTKTKVSTNGNIHQRLFSQRKIFISRNMLAFLLSSLDAVIVACLNQGDCGTLEEVLLLDLEEVSGGAPHADLSILHAECWISSRLPRYRTCSAVRIACVCSVKSKGTVTFTLHRSVIKINR